MTEAAVIFPHQLFRDNPCLKKDRVIYLVEDQWFFRDPVNQLKFHQQKLILHRATMQAYREFLEGQGFLIHYLEFVQDPQMGYLFDRLRQDGVEEIVICQLVERDLTERFTRQAAMRGVKLHILATPGFLCSEDDIKEFSKGRKTYHQTSFYIYQRRRWDILLEEGKPVGGRWPYDPLNRRNLP